MAPLGPHPPDFPHLLLTFYGMYGSLQPPHRLHDPRRIAAWTPLNDTVMGGVSSSRVIEHDGVLRFTGEVSLEHNGGFASMQTDVDLDLHDATGLTLRVRGDGQRYKLGVYDARGARTHRLSRPI